MIGHRDRVAGASCEWLTGETRATSRFRSRLQSHLVAELKEVSTESADYVVNEVSTESGSDRVSIGVESRDGG